MENHFVNVYYFRNINRIGGTEQFLYEMAKKYHKYDLTILYDEADFYQLVRLKKLVRCVRRKPGEKYYAEKAFYNFNIEAINQIEAKEHIFICHAIYQELGYKPPIDHPKITALLAVSKYAEKQLELQEQVMGVDKPIIQCYNPLSLEEPDKVVRLISACRLADNTKGGKRTMELIKALDRYCDENNRHYLWTIFTNGSEYDIKSPNVAIMKPRVDVRPYIADSDWLVQLSNDMESYCYSINEALEYGVRVLTTPLSVMKEFDVPRCANLILDWNCENIDEVAERVFEPKEKFVYKAPKTHWDRLLVHKPSNYTYKENKMLVKPLKPYYDVERCMNVSSWTPAWETTPERARELVDKGLVRVI